MEEFDGAPAPLSNFAKTLTQMRFLACAACHAVSPDLQRCSGCRRVGYCPAPATCQRRDWREGHQAMCKVLRLINQMMSSKRSRLEPRAPEATADALAEQVRVLASLVPAVLKRPVHDIDHRFVRQIPVCGHCQWTQLELAADSGALQPFLRCAGCQLTGCCSAACWAAFKPRHSAADCKKLASIMERDVIHFPAALRGKGFTPGFVPETRERQAPGPPAGDWQAYLTARGGTPMLTSLQFAATTDQLSSPLAALTALYAALPASALVAKTQLTMHLVGAASPEALGLRAWEEVLHVLPGLRRLRLLLIGPEAPGDDDDAAAAAPPAWSGLDCCPSCTALGGTRSYACIQRAYHEYAEACEASGAGFPAPDLLVALNCGFHDTLYADDWRPTLEHMLQQCTPLAFTSYCEDEALRDARMVAEAALAAGVALDWLRPPAPFELASEMWRPELNTEEYFPDKTYSSNAWLGVVVGRRMRKAVG